MEEILASIRRIIADDESAKPAAPASKPANGLNGAASAEPGAISQTDIDAMLAGFEKAEADAGAAPKPAEAAGPSANLHEDNAMRDGSAGAGAPDVLELTPSMEMPPDPAPAFRTIEGESDVVFADQPAVQPAPDGGREEAGARAAESEADALLSEQATAAAASAFGALAHTVLVKNARTLEDLVREMLRPMLKSWLDDNLPTIVERLVRAEIERVSRGRS